MMLWVSAVPTMLTVFWTSIGLETALGVPLQLSGPCRIITRFHFGLRWLAIQGLKTIQQLCLTYSMSPIRAVDRFQPQFGRTVARLMKGSLLLGCKHF